VTELISELISIRSSCCQLLLLLLLVLLPVPWVLLMVLRWRWPLPFSLHYTNIISERLQTCLVGRQSTGKVLNADALVHTMNSIDVPLLLV